GWGVLMRAEQGVGLFAGLGCRPKQAVAELLGGEALLQHGKYLARPGPDFRMLLRPSLSVRELLNEWDCLAVADLFEGAQCGEHVLLARAGQSRADNGTGAIGGLNCAELRPRIQERFAKGHSLAVVYELRIGLAQLG